MKGVKILQPHIFDGVFSPPHPFSLLSARIASTLKVVRNGLIHLTLLKSKIQTKCSSYQFITPRYFVSSFSTRCVTQREEKFDNKGGIQVCKQGKGPVVGQLVT